MNCGIYMIENLINGKKYIGQSINLQTRKKTHINNLKRNKHCNKHLQRAWNKYGEKNFQIKILELCDREFLSEKEMAYISYYDSYTNGYNLTIGGESTIGYKFTEEAKLKISLANSGRFVSDVTKKKISDSSSKKWADEKYREKQSKSRKEAWNKIGYRESRKKTAKKYWQSDEGLKRKEEISKLMSGSIRTDEHKNKLKNLYQGEKSMTAKLTENDVLIIRYRYLTGEGQTKISLDYPITNQTVYDIVNNRRWKHVPCLIEDIEKELREKNLSSFLVRKEVINND